MSTMLTKSNLFLSLLAGAGRVAAQGYFVAPTNATGSVPVPGFRLDRAYPGAWEDEANSRSWSLNINVTDDGRFTGLSIWLAPPPAGSPEGAVFGTNATSNATTNWIVPKNVTDTWRVVVVAFDFNQTRTVADPNDVENGSCPPSVLSDECMVAMRKFVQTRPDTVYNVGVANTGYLPVLPNVKNCTGYTKGTQKVLPLNQGYYSVAQRLYSYGGSLSGESSYDKYGSRTVPLMIIWAPAVKRSGGLHGADLPPVDESRITFSCVKADTLFQDNSTLPEGSQWIDDNYDGEGGSGGSGGQPPSAGSMLEQPGLMVWLVGIGTILAMVV